MRILHISDTHGYAPDLLEDVDVVVHSGDLLPNRTLGLRAIEEPFQKMWIEQHGEKLRAWLRDRPLLLVHGNHDFIDAVPVLRSVGIDAHGLDDRRFLFDGVVFYGFPHVPYFSGEWNFECGPRDLDARVQGIDLDGVDVLVAHAPIFGLRDRNADGERCGSKPMRALLKASSYSPRWYLHGHIHESAGVQRWIRDIDISNAACTQRVITL